MGCFSCNDELYGYSYTRNLNVRNNHCVSNLSEYANLIT